MQHLIGKPGI